MKRTALVATLALVAVSPAVAHAAPKSPKPTKRTLTATYSGFQGMTNPAVAFNSNCSGNVGDCFDFDTVKGEKTVVISVADKTGTPVGLQVWADGDFNSEQTVCGTVTLTLTPKTAHPVSVRPVPTDSCAALPTTGTLTAVITNK